MCFEVGGAEPSLSSVEPSLTYREMLKSCRKTPEKLVDVTEFERYSELRWLFDKEGRLGCLDFFCEKSFALRPNAPYSIDRQHQSPFD